MLTWGGQQFQSTITCFPALARSYAHTDRKLWSSGLHLPQCCCRPQNFLKILKKFLLFNNILLSTEHKHRKPSLLVTQQTHKRDITQSGYLFLLQSYLSFKNSHGDIPGTDFFNLTFKKPFLEAMAEYQFIKKHAEGPKVF